MHNSDSAIGIDFGWFNRNRNQEYHNSMELESIENWLESESEFESDFWVNLESESESHKGRNSASLI